MNRKKLLLTVAAAAITSVFSLPGNAKETSLVLPGVVTDHGEYKGTPVSFLLSYDSALPPSFTDELHRSEYTLSVGDNTSLSIKVGETTFTSMTAPGSSFPLNVRIETFPGQEGMMYLDYTGPLFDTSGNGSEIYGLTLSLPLPSTSDLSLPGSASDIGPVGATMNHPQGVPFNLSMPGASLSGELIGVHRQPVPGCSSQATYAVSAAAGAAGSVGEMAVRAMLTITPKSFVGDNPIQDTGISSSFNITVGDETYYSREYSPDMPQTGFQINQHPGGVSIHMPEIVLPGASHTGFADLIINNPEPSDSTAPSFPDVITVGEFGTADLMYDLGQGMISAAVSSIDLVSGGCKVYPAVSTSNANTLVEPTPEGNTLRAVVPSKGGKVYFDRSFYNTTKSQQKFRRWSEIVFPDGQVVPHGGMKTLTVEPGSLPFQESASAVWINKLWPDGIYRYKTYIMGVEDQTPESTSIVFRKGDESVMVPYVK